jgi:hypothetical protein
MGTTISATSGDIRFERITASKTTIVANPSNGNMIGPWFVVQLDQGYFHPLDKSIEII